MLVKDNYAKQVQKKRRAELKQLAERAKLDADEFVVRSHEHMQSLMQQTRLSVRVPRKHFFHVINGGLKNQHEAGHSNGYYNPKTRHSMEQNVWGSNPVYGYLSTWTNDWKAPVAGYGDVQFVLRDHVLDRTTVTFGDSLSPLQHALTAPCDYHDPQWLATTAGIHPLALRHLTPGSRLRKRYGHAAFVYAEAQILGGVKPSDIEAVIINDAGPKTRAAAEAVGIEVCGVGQYHRKRLHRVDVSAPVFSSPPVTA